MTLIADLHYQKADMALGHEGAGVVEAVGPDSKVLKVGDRVGWGYVHDSCGHCLECLQGWETFCPERQMYGYADLDQGSFASHAVWRESFLFKLPDGLSDVEAAPLVSAQGLPRRRGSLTSAMRRRHRLHRARGRPSHRCRRRHGCGRSGPLGHPVCCQDGMPSHRPLGL
jgi:NADPH:quinone reductase-like Zn-dependent oxidoreductase